MPPTRPRIAWRRVDGVLLFDKPVGMSSNDALQKVRRLLRAEKGGHTGTLDPLASGLLPLCFGEATKFAHDLLDADKTYETVLRLGVRTDSGDRDGAVESTRPVACGEAEIRAVLARFHGEIDQIPPMHSALKRNGVPLYKLARQGIEVERAPRRVNIRQLELLNCDLPDLHLRVRCSKGTYIRSLGRDIGEALGCGAHLAALRRTSVAGLDIADAVDFSAIEAALARGDELKLLRSADSLVEGLPAVRLDASAEVRVVHGNAVRVPLPGGERFRIFGVDGRFMGVGIRAMTGELQPQRLLRSEPEAISPMQKIPEVAA